MSTKLGNNFKVHQSILAPVETPDSLIGALWQTKRYNHRVTIYYGDPTSGEAWHSETGYIGVEPVRDNVSIMTVVPYSNGEHGGQIELDSVVRVEHANRKTGVRIWPAAQKQLFE